MRSPAPLAPLAPPLLALRSLAALALAALTPSLACQSATPRTDQAASTLDSPYTLAVDTPASGATVQGAVTLSGTAHGFVNVEVWDATHQSPPLARATPQADGSFAMTVDTTTLPSGNDAWTVWGWDSPAGQPAAHWDSVPIAVTIVAVPAYTLTVTAPASGATVQGSVTVTGVANGFVNVEVWDAAHQSPPLARATPSADGTFSATVDTTSLTNGSDAWTVWAWDSPAGQPAANSASVPLSVTIANGVSVAPPAEDAGTGAGGSSGTSGGLPYAIGLALGGDSWSRVEGELGRPMDIVQTYNWDDTWSDWVSVSGPVTDDNGSPIPHPATLSVALILTSGTDLATAASGGYDSYYQELAQNLANAGTIPGTSTPAIAAVRIGWEMNGYWFPWGIANSSAQVDPTAAANYVAAFRRLAGFIRQYAPTILIDWCVNQSGADPTSAYPGDDVVDIVGMDLYEQNVGSFQDAVGNGQDFLLSWLDAFSNATYGANAPAGKTGGKKLMSFPEWQATSNDGAFITQMAAWMNARGNRISYWAYWDSDADINPGGSLWENAAVDAAFTAAWKGTTFGGTIPLTFPAGF